MFVDEATVSLRAGDGGKGCAGFRREKFIPRGGPDGGGLSATKTSETWNATSTLRTSPQKTAARVWGV